MSGELRLTLLGGMEMTRDGQPVTGFISSKVQALVCYLAVTGRPQPRPALASLLWSEMADAGAGANLRVALSNLNRLLAPHLLVTRQTVGLNPASASWVDVAAFESGTAQPVATLGRLREAAALYRGPLLDGFTVRNAPPFDEWLLGRREWLRQRALQALWRLSAQAGQAGDYPAAIDYTGRLLALEPWLEEAHRQLIRLLALSGQRGAAIAQYQVCRRVLDAELGVEPLPETTELFRRVRLGDLRYCLHPPALDLPLDIPA